MQKTGPTRMKTSVFYAFFHGFPEKRPPRWKTHNLIIDNWLYSILREFQGICYCE